MSRVCNQLQHVFGNRVCFVGAHSDDVEMNSGGLINRLRRQGIETLVVVLTGGPGPRFRETVEAQKALGNEDLLIVRGLNGKDTRLAEHRHLIISELEDVVESYKAHTVVTHFHGDTHQDHVEAHTIVAAACRNIPSSIMFRPTYPSGRCDIPFHPTLFVDLDDDAVAAKTAAMRCFKSQLGKYGEDRWVQSVLAANAGDSWSFNGKHGHCETFQVSRLSL